MKRLDTFDKFSVYYIFFKISVTISYWSNQYISNLFVLFCTFKGNLHAQDFENRKKGSALNREEKRKGTTTERKLE